MSKETFSRLFPHPELFKHPTVMDDSLQFKEEKFPFIGNVKPLYNCDKKIRHAAKKALLKLSQEI